MSQYNSRIYCYGTLWVKIISSLFKVVWTSSHITSPEIDAKANAEECTL